MFIASAIMNDLLEFGDEKRIVITFDFYFDSGDIWFDSLHKKEMYISIDFKGNLFIAAQVIYIAIIINVFHLHRDTVIVEQREAANCMSDQVLRLGCWVSLESWGAILEGVGEKGSFSIMSFRFKS